MRTTAVFLALMVLATGISAVPPCPKGINLLPKYGRAKKCLEQLEADHTFIAHVEQQYGSRKEAAAKYVELGWDYLSKNQVTTAMSRFNQAWLLDSLNKEIEWDFGSTLGEMGKNQEAISYLKKAVALNPTSNRVMGQMGVSYGNVYGETKRTAYLDTAIVYFRRSIKLDPDDARIVAELAKAYHFYPQPDSAKKYLAIADKINPIQVDWRIREKINGEQ